METHTEDTVSNVVLVEHGDILDTTAEALVVPVDATGMMSSALAGAVRRRWPEHCSPWARRCRARRPEPGEVFGNFQHGRTAGPWLIFAVTLRDARGASRFSFCGGRGRVCHTQ